MNNLLVAETVQHNNFVLVNPNSNTHNTHDLSLKKPFGALAFVQVVVKKSIAKTS